ncbi:egg cell-secreted protein 1.2 [Brachypodium distachyon]|uniref:Prolamin-like domain-containing protein n=1 Tax=Brachypodium distachyon TaxID=15368 RepID=I1IN82_BRADI|nr:egg cell-secreted protein 1.2 [Brachypodium distachyon]KQJ89282.1 hypothetical protein BRADI_4g24640v3 [Brachypodium distachyon]|eukprot:XP_003576261.1 egg cell-secreted protein 1.2 [Brachypodium distachyon]
MAAAALLIPLLASTLLVVSGATAASVSSGPALPPLADRVRLASASFSSFPQTAGGEGEQQQGGWSWLAECWGAVAELRACTDEMVLFFLNGQSYLGRPCCLAIRTVTAHCWPAMLDAVGFTAREADVLRGFCDAEISSGAPPPPPSPATTITAPAPAKHA